MNKILRGAIAAGLGLGLIVGGAACTDNDANVVNENLSTDADNFKVLRRVVFVNGITDKILLSVEGYCSVDPGDAVRMTVTCKSGNSYFRNALGKSDNTFWYYEQLVNSNVSPDHYKIVFKPETLIPQPEIR